MTRIGPQNLAMIAVALSGIVWGVFWIPLRALDQAGIAGVWAIVLFYALPTLLLAPLMIVRRRGLASGGASLHIAGLLAGTALVLYAGALIFTDVVRTLLFFYLTPLWSTVLARIALGEAITTERRITIALAVVGLLVLVKVDTGFDVSLNAGDLMGIASGIVWAAAAVFMRSRPEGNGVDFTLSYFAWGCVAALLLTALPLDGADSLPDPGRIVDVLPWLLPVMAFLVIPPAFAIIWGATVLSPGLLSILFMTEIGAGAVTAAIWADEPFGLREGVGIALITAAGLLEPVLQIRRAKAAPAVTAP